jgi:hypothetical protein
MRKTNCDLNVHCVNKVSLNGQPNEFLGPYDYTLGCPFRLTFTVNMVGHIGNAEVSLNGQPDAFLWPYALIH